jgi:hypothetical protein
MVGPSTTVCPLAFVPVGVPTRSTSAALASTAVASGRGWLALQVSTLARGNAGQPKARAFSTPDRAVSIPDCLGRTAESRPGGYDGSGEEQQKAHSPSLPAAEGSIKALLSRHSPTSPQWPKSSEWTWRTFCGVMIAEVHVNDDGQADPTEVITAMFGVLTARLEDAAGLAVDGQDRAADHRAIANEIASQIAEATILIGAIEALAAKKAK